MGLVTDDSGEQLLADTMRDLVLGQLADTLTGTANAVATGRVPDVTGQLLLAWLDLGRLLEHAPPSDKLRELAAGLLRDAAAEVRRAARA